MHLVCSAEHWWVHLVCGAEQWWVHLVCGAEQWWVHLVCGAEQWWVHLVCGAEQWWVHLVCGAEQWWVGTVLLRMSNDTGFLIVLALLAVLPLVFKTGTLRLVLPAYTEGVVHHVVCPFEL